jgi:hypothetical protein
VHTGAFEARANGNLASGLDNAGRSAQILDVEFRVTHAMAVGLEIVETTASFLRVGYLAPDGVEQSQEFSGAEFFLPAFCPLSSPWDRKELFRDRSSATWRESGRRSGGPQETAFRQCSKSKEHHPLALPDGALGLAPDALGERRPFGSGVGCASTL